VNIFPALIIAAVSTNSFRLKREPALDNATAATEDGEEVEKRDGRGVDVRGSEMPLGTGVTADDDDGDDEQDAAADAGVPSVSSAATRELELRLCLCLCMFQQATKGADQHKEV